MKSLWQDTSNFKEFPTLKNNTRTSVLIIGGGISGILTAYMLHKKNVPYILVEKGRICEGVSAHTTAKITYQHGLIYDKLIKGMGVEKARMYLDAVPYIGQYSHKTPNMYVASSFNKWGMTSSMAAAMILSDMVTEVKNDYAAVFNPSRSILKPQLLANGFESTKNLLTITDKRCPHLGCALKWNKQEHSWDCACHGSRFSEDGKVLDNPANGDLGKIARNR